MLDNAQFDLHKVPSRPAKVDDADYPEPPRPKYLIDEAEEKARRQSMENYRRGSVRGLLRRATPSHTRPDHATSSETFDADGVRC